MNRYGPRALRRQRLLGGARGPIGAEVTIRHRLGTPDIEIASKAARGPDVRGLLRGGRGRGRRFISRPISPSSTTPPRRDIEALMSENPISRQLRGKLGQGGGVPLAPRSARTTVNVRRLPEH